MKISKLVQKLYEEKKITLKVAVQLLDKIYEDWRVHGGEEKQILNSITKLSWC